MWFVVFDNDSIWRILHVKRRGFVPSGDSRCHPRLTRIAVQIFQRRVPMGWSCYEMSWEWGLHLPTLPRTLAQTHRRRVKHVGSHDHGKSGVHSGPRLFDYAQWRKGCVEFSIEFAQDRHAFVRGSQPHRGESLEQGLGFTQDGEFFRPGRLLLTSPVNPPLPVWG